MIMSKVKKKKEEEEKEKQKDLTGTAKFIPKIKII